MLVTQRRNNDKDNLFPSSGETKTIEKLTANEKLLLEQYFRAHSIYPIDETKQPGVSARLSGAEAAVAFLYLRKKGWINCLTKGWGEYHYHIPLERVPYLIRIINPPQTIYTKEQVVICQESSSSIISELLRFFCWTVCNGLPITANKQIHQKTVKKISALTTVTQKLAEQWNINVGDESTYPANVHFLLNVACGLNILKKDKTCFLIDEIHLSSWLKLQWSEMEKKIFMQVIKTYICTTKQKYHLMSILVCCGDLVDSWINIVTLREWMIEQKLAACHTLRLDDIQKDLDLLCGIGFGEIGKSHDDRLCFRWNMQNKMDGSLFMDFSKNKEPSLESNDSCFFVQPNFEILVPLYVQPQVIWFLECFCERIRVDRMSIYRLSEESVARAIRMGWSFSECLKKLKKYASGDIPTHIIDALHQWKKECPLPDDDIRVKWSSVHQIKDSSVPCDMHNKQQTPVISTLFPNFFSIPLMWWRDMRSYHPSTARQIVEQAIAWRTKLEVIVEQQSLFIIPEHIIPGNPWCVVARQFNMDHVTLSPAQWSALKICLPFTIAEMDL